jgi:hypothetical protein
MDLLSSMPLLLSFMADGVIMVVPDITVDIVVIMEAMATAVTVVDIVLGITDALQKKSSTNLSCKTTLAADT